MGHWVSKAEDRSPVHTGGCQCGAVRYAFYAEPIRVGVCHCKMCRRATGGPFAALADIAHKDFGWTKGEPKSYQSSNRAFRDFCANCGTPLSYREIGGANMEILLGTFDNPEPVAPTYAVGIESELSWTRTIHTLPGKTFADYVGEEDAAKIESRQDPGRNTH
jgi:hypothetical protein